MSKFKVEVEHIPTIGAEQCISRARMRLKLQEALSWDRIKLTDNLYYYPSWDDWGKIFYYVQQHLPYYLIDKFDCDNFANLISSRVSEKFKINTCAEVEGMAWLPDEDGVFAMRRHAWNVFFDGTFYQLESQIIGEIVDIDCERYIPDEITMG